MLSRSYTYTKQRSGNKTSHGKHKRSETRSCVTNSIRNQQGNRIENDWKANNNIHKHLSKFNKKSSRNLSKIGPKIGQKSIPSRLWNRPFFLIFRHRFRNPFLDRFGSHFGSNLGPSWGPSWAHVGQKNYFWRFPRAYKNDNDFQQPSEPSWDRFWNDLGVQNRTKIGPRSVSRAIIAQKHASSFRPTKTNGFCTFFIPQEVKNRQKIVLKAILSWDAKRTPKNNPKLLQHGSKFRPSWGRVGL